MVKNLPANAGDVCLIPDLGRSPGEGSGNLPQYSCLGNHMDRGAWQAIVHGVTKSQTQLSKCDVQYTGTHTHTHTHTIKEHMYACFTRDRALRDSGTATIHVVNICFCDLHHGDPREMTLDISCLMLSVANYKSTHRHSWKWSCALLQIAGKI